MAEPLAARLRPKSLKDICGQQHLLADGAVFSNFIKSGSIPNMVFFGPSGVGKTTVASIIAEQSGKNFYKLNGTSASTQDIKAVIADINTLHGRDGILLYLDEIQYLNRKQQQSLLECIEDGSITLIASTTENPYFYVYNALLSRCTVFEFKPLSAQDVEQGLYRAIDTLEKQLELKVDIEKETVRFLSAACGGDMRKALNAVELLVAAAPATKKKKAITLSMAQQVAQRSSMRYDREQDVHYDLLSALQKSIRGSDPDAAIHYLARILTAEDLLSACRRLLVIAAEDIGLAYPQAIPIVKACVDSSLQLGLPEGAIPLAEAAILLATAPKSNAANEALGKAMADIKAGRYGDVPAHLKGASFAGAEKLGRGVDYLYPHSYPDNYVKQQYLPDELLGTTYYEYGTNKAEQAAREYWNKIKNKDKE